MASYPRARQRRLPESGHQRRITPTQAIAHSAVGRGSIREYFGRPDVVVESTIWIGLDEAAGVEQYMDTEEKAEAQYLGNPRALSAETADNGHPDAFPWTPYQCEELAQFFAWCHIEHGIPLRLCRTWDDPGIGYHRQFPQWNPNKHSCPGDARIKQLPAIIARAKQIVAGADTPAPQEDDDMQLNDTVRLGDGAAAALGEKDHALTVEEALRLAAQGGKAAVQMQRVVAGLVGELVALRTAVAALSKGQGGTLTEAQLAAVGKASGEAFADRLAAALSDGQ